MSQRAVDKGERCGVSRDKPAHRQSNEADNT